MSNHLPVPHPRPFNLTRWFSVLSLLCVASISAVLALLLSNFLTDKMLHRDAALTMEFVQSVVLGDKATTYFLAGESGGTSKDLEDTFSYFAHMPDVLRANVYARDRSVAWSSDKSLIGRKFAANDELDEALAGELVVNSGVVSKEEHVSAEHPFSEKGVKYFIETYVPLWDHARKGVIGVVEVYRTPDALFETIRAGQRLIWASTALGGLFLYAVLFWIVRRADGIMREQQQRLVETEKLAAVGEMASAVAHGIRNPLASIRSSAELALDGETGPSRDSAQDIIEAADRLEKLVRNLLSYSHPLSGSLRNIGINALLRESLGNFARDMERRNIALSLDLQEPLPFTEGDAALLAQVINSLIANALEAMSENGRVTVTSRVAKDRKHVLVTITDTGPGIGPAEMGKIFKPFFTTKAKGLGIGLPLARRVIERCGGAIAIESSPGQGASVHLRFPVST